MECEDSVFDEEVNEVVISSYAGADISDVFDGYVPTELDGDELASALRVSNVMDVATEEFNIIYGSNLWLLLGNSITLDAEGEGVKMFDKKTGTLEATATVEGVTKGQRARCKFLSLSGVNSGAKYLEITSKGLIGEDTPRIFRKNVTFVAAAIPTPTFTSKVGDPSSTEGGMKEDDEYLAVTGTGLKPDGVTVRLALSAAVEGKADHIDLTSSEIAEHTATNLKFSLPGAYQTERVSPLKLQLLVSGNVIGETSFTVEA